MSHVLLGKEKVGGKFIPVRVYDEKTFEQNKHLLLVRRGEWTYRVGTRAEVEQYAKDKGREIKYKEKVEKNKPEPIPESMPPTDEITDDKGQAKAKPKNK